MKTQNKKYNSEITKEDINILGDKEQHLRNDGGEDTYLKNRAKDVDFTGKDLDVPGRTLPKNKTEKAYKDEENQLYSLGSEDNENLEINTINSKK